MGRRKGGALSLKSLNHISILCNCLEQSVNFYQNILGFRPIKRPSSFNFNGAWYVTQSCVRLYNYGFGIHLLEREEHKNPPKKHDINTNGNNISFQCESLVLVEKKLEEMGISYIHRRDVQLGLSVEQLFFHDPDGFLIKICYFENLPMIPLQASEHAAGGGYMQAGQLPPQATVAEAAPSTPTAEDHSNEIMIYS